MGAADREQQLAQLAAAPAFLRALLAEIPAEMLKLRRIAGKWTIHEHAVHLTMVDEVMTARLEQFRTEAQPVIRPYEPGEDEAPDALMSMDLPARLALFDHSRPRLIEAFRALALADWDKAADHPEYFRYTPAIMLRHLVMHEYLHGYRIEQLWLTRDAYLH